MTTAEQVQDQIDKNYTAFTALLPDLMKTSAGKWALLRDAALEGVFDTARDARLAGEKLYADGLFSVQQVRNRAVDLGLSIPSFFYQMTPKISLNTRCSINISENLSINGRTRSSGQFGICSYNINP